MIFPHSLIIVNPPGLGNEKQVKAGSNCPQVAGLQSAL
jgi:hypothetical protein